ncbi:hypothetical protein acdb102_22300 [Acidothermaceae bacterium B102]|nr:hypothetical protein acdb102_22300 [Acidothermaceae bacterium B102]
MELSEDAALCLHRQVKELRHAAGLSTPVNVDRLYEHLGLRVAGDLYGDQYDHYLKLQTSPTLADALAFRDGTCGVIDPRNGDVFVDMSLSRPQLIFTKIHEAMHWYLGHCVAVQARPRLLRDGRQELEVDASYATVDLLAPAEEFTEYLAATTPVGARPNIRQIRQAGTHFQLTTYTALRRYVETATTPVALATLSFPRNYRGGGPERDLRQVVRSSQAWRARFGGPATTYTALATTSATGRRARAALLGGDRQTVREAVDCLARRYDCQGEPWLSSESIHALLRPRI